MNRNQIMMDLYTQGFVRDDAALFLDTHPDSSEARSLFQSSQSRYEEAVHRAAEEGMPMFQSLAVSDCAWNWTDSPWPWEGGMC